jgi:hypothetical protein
MFDNAAYWQSSVLYGTEISMCIHSKSTLGHKYVKPFTIQKYDIFIEVRRRARVQHA